MRKRSPIEGDQVAPGQTSATLEVRKARDYSGASQPAADGNVGKNPTCEDPGPSRRF
jgi:hypothetical protein